MPKQKTTNNPETLELEYKLAELPSSQHRAGLAGLVLMVDWLRRQGNRGICELTKIDEFGATFRLDQQGLAELFDQTYAASKEEQGRPQPLKNKNKELIPPIREEVKEDTDSKTGKTKTKTIYVYEVTVPKGAFLTELDSSANGNSGLWIKLWRDVIWNIFRGVPATRKPFDDRADGNEPDDARKVWNDLVKPLDYVVDLPSTYFIGAQACNAENVPFTDRARYQFLLHFWPYVAQIYVPAVLNNEGNREFVGYAIAIPDVSNLEWFCEDLPRAMKDRGVEVSGYRPKDAVVDIAVESALDMLKRLRDRIEIKEGGRKTSDLVLGIDVIHVEKQGNNIRLLGATRVDPDIPMIDEYARIRSLFWNPTFRRQRLLNLVSTNAGTHWYTGFDSLFGCSPYEHSIGSKSFRHDAKESLREFLNGDENMNQESNESIDKETGTPSCESLVYRIVGSYLSKKLDLKYGIKWPDAQKDAAKTKEYGEKREKIAKEAFLAIRSRTGDDFINYFASTLCSVAQFLDEDSFVALTQALYNDPEKIRTITMLALSARA